MQKRRLKDFDPAKLANIRSEAPPPPSGPLYKYPCLNKALSFFIVFQSCEQKINFDCCNTML